MWGLFPNLFISVPVFADDSAGQIQSFHPPVTITRADGMDIPASNDIPLYPGDRIITGEKGRVEFLFHNGPVFILEEDAEVLLDELIKTDAKRPSYVLNLISGFLKSIIEPVRDGQSDPLIYTPTSVIGVRGTEFDTVAAIDGGTAIAVDRGAVAVTANDNDDQVILKVGRMVELDVEGHISKPVLAPRVWKRDWRAWRKARKQKFLTRLPSLLPVLEKRFQAKIGNFKELNTQTLKDARDMMEYGLRYKNARQNQNRRVAAKARRKFQGVKLRFQKNITAYTLRARRVKFSSRMILRMKNAFEKNRSLFKPADQQILAAQLDKMAGESTALLQMIRKTGMKIKKFKKIKKNS